MINIASQIIPYYRILHYATYFTLTYHRFQVQVVGKPHLVIFDGDDASVNILDASVNILDAISKI